MSAETSSVSESSSSDISIVVGGVAEAVSLRSGSRISMPGLILHAALGGLLKTWESKETGRSIMSCEC